MIMQNTLVHCQIFTKVLLLVCHIQESIYLPNPFAIDRIWYKFDF